MKERGTESSHLLFMSCRGMKTPCSPSLPSSLQSSTLGFAVFWPVSQLNSGEAKGKQKGWQKAGASVLLGLTLIWVQDTSRVQIQSQNCAQHFHLVKALQSQATHPLWTGEIYSQSFSSCSLLCEEFSEISEGLFHKCLIFIFSCQAFSQHQQQHSNQIFQLHSNLIKSNTKLFKAKQE